MSYKIVRSGKEVDRVLNWAMDSLDEGGSKYPGATYEEGVVAMLQWLVGEDDFAPDGHDDD